MIKLGALLIVAALLVLYGWTVMSKYDEPDYQVLESEADIEIRAYQPFIIAEVAVTGEREEAISVGFRLLADYIFGNNQVQATATASKEKIPMTTPVLQQPSKKIAMTVPVMQDAKDNQWLVRFVMPKHYTLETIPKPNNPKVTLREVLAQNTVVLRFSGGSSKANLERHLKQLIDYVATHKLAVSGEPTYAFYNPPWTLPFLRRNEIMFKLVSK
jgi:hypothetical protein